VTKILPTVAEWKATMLEDVELQALDADVAVPPTAKGSDLDIKLTTTANALGILTSNQVIQAADMDPTNAEGDALEAIRIADGLPEVPANPASGKIRVKSTALTTVTVVDGTKLLCPGAMYAQVVGTVTGVVTGSELPIVMLKAGSAGNLAAGTKVRFTDAPSGLATEAVIVEDMTDGADVESDPKKRRRILNRRQNPPKSANWSHVREVALGATNAIDNVVVYSAIGGPASQKTVALAPWFNSGNGQSRAASAGAIAAVEGALADAFDTGSNLFVVQSPINELTSLRLLLKLRSGNAAWIDQSPWPRYATEVDAVTSALQFDVLIAAGELPPTVGKSIAIWSVADLGFRTAVIQSVLHSGIEDARYSITVSAWEGGAFTNVAGLWLSPAAGNMKAWGDAMLEIFGLQTPGENCLAYQEPGSLRRPVESNDEPAGFGAREVGAFVDQFDEIDTAQVESIGTSLRPVDAGSDTLILSIEPQRALPANPPNVLTLCSLSLGVL
jgi:hypothetical protein